MNKKIKGRNYGSIPHLSTSKVGEHDKYVHEGQERIILNGGRDKHDRITVTLKLDGTNVGVAKINGEIVALQRKGYACESSPYRQHHEFSKWVKANNERFDKLLHEGDRIAGEWLWQASGIKYKIVGEPFFAFDYFPYYGEGKERMSRAAMVEHLDVNGPWVRRAPLLYDSRSQQGDRAGLASFKGLLKTHQLRGLLDHVTPWDDSREIPWHEEHEGLIFRVERKGKFDFLAKWVRQDYQPGRYLNGIGLPADADPILNQVFTKP